MGINIKKPKALAFGILSAIPLLLFASLPALAVDVAPVNVKAYPGNGACVLTMNISTDLAHITADGGAQDGIWIIRHKVHTADEYLASLSSSWDDSVTINPPSTGALEYKVDTTPTNDLYYYYKVYQTFPWNTYGDSDGALCHPTASSVAPVPFDSSPTLSGTSGDSQNAISWASVTGATSYDIYKGGTFLVNVSAITYSDIGLSNGIAYLYKVKAKNDVFTSSFSNEVSLTPTPGIVTSPDTGVTTRDVTLISFLLACFIGYLLIRPFRWRHE
jgi:hypothetical protein